jgi:hypothetical protein
VRASQAATGTMGPKRSRPVRRSCPRPGESRRTSRKSRAGTASSRTTFSSVWAGSPPPGTDHRPGTPTIPPSPPRRHRADPTTDHHQVRSPAPLSRPRRSPRSAPKGETMLRASPSRATTRRGTAGPGRCDRSPASWRRSWPVSRARRPAGSDASFDRDGLLADDRGPTTAIGAVGTTALTVGVLLAVPSSSPAAALATL